MKISLFIILGLFAYGIQAEGTTCDTSNNMLYKEMGCKPKRTDEKECVLEYDCSHFGNYARDKCYYNGKEYSLNSGLDQKDSLDHCLAACTCFQRGSRTQFGCAVVECSSLFVPPPFPPCYYKYNLHNCCETTYCPKPDESVHTCTYEGKTYKDGQRIYTGNKICICNEHFNDSLSTESCDETRCGYELLYFENIIGFNCAPVFYESNDGCPIQHRCVNDTGDLDAVVPKSTPGEPATTSGDILEKCKFGSLELRIGEQLSKPRIRDCIECTCNVPPLVTCTRIKNCEIEIL